MPSDSEQLSGYSVLLASRRSALVGQRVQTVLNMQLVCVVPLFVVIILVTLGVEKAMGGHVMGGKACSSLGPSKPAPLVLLPIIGMPSWAVIKMGVGPSAHATARKYTVAGGPSTPCQ